MASNILSLTQGIGSLACRNSINIAQQSIKELSDNVKALAFQTYNL